MDDKQLQKIQDEIMSEMDRESQIEKNISNSTEAITQHLIARSKCHTEINGTEYMFSYRLLKNETQNILYLLVANVVKFKLAGNQYVPYSATAPMDMQYSESDNLKVVVEAFIRHITDRVKVGTLED